jgi:hypothetical protein
MILIKKLLLRETNLHPLNPDLFLFLSLRHVDNRTRPTLPSQLRARLGDLATRYDEGVIDQNSPAHHLSP